MIGKIISHYKIIEKLGEGGTGKVYKALDLKLERIVSLKLFPALNLNQNIKSHFFDKVRTASLLDHPNIGKIYRLGETSDKQLFIAMAYYEGQTLTEILRHRRLSVTEIIEISYQIAQGLAKAHFAGIIHRHLTPSKIILNKDGNVKIVDFGEAQLTDQTTQFGNDRSLGTTSYWSPEQILGEFVDHRTDIWSLGVLMHEMLTGRLPFTGDDNQTIIDSVQKTNPKPMGNVKNLPPELETIIFKAINKDPGNRYQHISALKSDLEQIRVEPHRQSSPKSVLRRERKSQYFLYLIPIIMVMIFTGLFLFPHNTHNQEYLKTIAVLPFENLSPDPENAYFCDGITEELRILLSQISDLQVISRTSVMQYRNTRKNLKTIAAELNAGAILEGSIMRYNNQTRIVLRLFDAQNERQLWGETYDRNIKDIFSIQNNAATKISSVLKAEIPNPVQQRIEKRSTTDLTAYDYYLKGREYANIKNKNDNFNDNKKYAISLYKSALKADPNFAHAYAGLAEIYSREIYPVDLDIVSPSWKDSALQAVEQALLIDDQISEAYHAMGRVYSVMGWKQKAMNAFNKAIELKPSNDKALSNVSRIYLNLGEYEKALVYCQKALKLVPIRFYNYDLMGDIYRGMNEYANAIYWYEKNRELNPHLSLHGEKHWQILQFTPDQALQQFKTIIESNSTKEWYFHDQAALYQNLFGMAEEAIGLYKKALEINPRNPWHYIGLAGVYIAHGKMEEASAVFEKGRKIARNSVRFNLNYSFHLARTGHPEAAHEIAVFILQKIPNDYWLTPVIHFYVGEMTESEFIRETRDIFVDVEGKMKLANEPCYYFGMSYLHYLGTNFPDNSNIQKGFYYLNEYTRCSLIDYVENPIVSSDLESWGIRQHETLQ